MQGNTWEKCLVSTQAVGEEPTWTPKYTKTWIKQSLVDFRGSWRMGSDLRDNGSLTCQTIDKLYNCDIDGKEGRKEGRGRRTFVLLRRYEASAFYNRQRPVQCRSIYIMWPLTQARENNTIQRYPRRLRVFQLWYTELITRLLILFHAICLPSTEQSSGLIFTEQTTSSVGEEQPRHCPFAEHGGSPR